MVRGWGCVGAGEEPLQAFGHFVGFELLFDATAVAERDAAGFLGDDHANGVGFLGDAESGGGRRRTATT